MKQKRLWAHVLAFVTQVTLVVGMFAALPASAQERWIYWYTMHEGSFGITNESAVEQCYDSIGLIEGLASRHCEALKAKLTLGECRVTWVKDGVRYAGMRGRVDGNPQGESRLTLNMIKQIGRLDRSLRCDLGDGIVVDWFTGHWIDGKYMSCNNLGFLYVLPKPPPPPPPPPPPVGEEDELVCFDEPLGGVNPSPEGEVLFLNGAIIESCCCVGAVDFVPSLYVDQRSAPTVSQGSTRRCVPKSSLKRR